MNGERDLGTDAAASLMNMTTLIVMSAEPSPAPKWRKYVAIGDSFTEGLNDVDPQNPEAFRGWADLLAASLHSRITAVEPQAQFKYANLAIRGRLTADIVGPQLDAALALQPDLVSMVGGGNDILRPQVNPDILALRLEQAVIAIRKTGADVLLATGMDTKESPIVSKTRGRTALLNANIWSIARRHGAYVLDLWGMRALRDWRMWSQDRIHLTTDGHKRVTQAALVALGLEADDPNWDVPLEPEALQSRLERMQEDAEWFKTHVFPWATRRLRGRSSGDARVAKRPEWTEL